MDSTLKLFTASLKMLLRDSQALLVALIFPLIFILAFRLFDLSIEMGGVVALGDQGDQGEGNRYFEYFDYALPGIMAMGMAQFAVFSVAVSISRFREQHILSRILVTPASPAMFVAGQVVTRILLVLLQTALLLGVALVLQARFGLGALWTFVLVIPGILIFLNIGFALVGWTRSMDAAVGLANVIVLPLVFLSGVFLPVEALPDVLRTVVSYLPLTAIVEMMRGVFYGGLSADRLIFNSAVLAGWVLATSLIATRSFRFGTT